MESQGERTSKELGVWTHLWTQVQETKFLPNKPTRANNNGKSQGPNGYPKPSESTKSGRPGAGCWWWISELRCRYGERVDLSFLDEGDYNNTVYSNKMLYDRCTALVQRSQRPHLETAMHYLHVNWTSQLNQATDVITQSGHLLLSSAVLLLLLLLPSLQSSDGFYSFIFYSIIECLILVEYPIPVKCPI